VIQQFLSRQFLVFLITGGTAAAVNFSSRILYNQWVSFSSAIILAYITGMITAFVLARLFVFRDSTRSMRQSALFFTLVNVLAVAQTWLISLGMLHYVLPMLNFTWHPKEIAHAIGIVVPVFSSYLGHKHWTFR
jgi:putative flippase GtrA